MLLLTSPFDYMNTSFGYWPPNLHPTPMTVISSCVANIKYKITRYYFVLRWLSRKMTWARMLLCDVTFLFLRERNTLLIMSRITSRLLHLIVLKLPSIFPTSKKMLLRRMIFMAAWQTVIDYVVVTAERGQ